MADAESKFNAIAEKLATRSGTMRGQMFGKPCVKTLGKAFTALYKDEMVFKLSGEAHTEALAFKSAHLWDPSGKGRPMKEWVCIPAANSSTWEKFAKLAQGYIFELSGK